MAVKFAQHSAKWYYYMEILKTTAFAIIAFFSFVSAALSEAAASSEHNFEGSWITSDEFARLPKTDMFHRQLDSKRAAEVAAAAKIKNRHILFRKTFELAAVPENAKLFFSADDYAKIYINGKFAVQGPAAGYPSHYLYHEIDVSKFLKKGVNTIAVHSYYQGLINRVWVSGDNRHGFICDLVCDGKVLVKTGKDWKISSHGGFSEVGRAGYDTQFLERYDAGAPEVGFERPEFDDSNWGGAALAESDYKLFPSPLKTLEFETVCPIEIKHISKNRILVDFGGMYIGYFSMSAKGKDGDVIELRYAQELNSDGSARYKLRANCNYREFFELSGGERDYLNQFDFKSFRYAEIILPENSQAKADEKSFKLIARHMPFKLAAKCRYQNDAKAQKIWDLCVRSIKYGVQEQIQDCMEREKGYYLGDGCYTMLTWCLLTNDYAPMRKMIDDFLRTSFINEGLVTCANCSFMQEIAEYPFMMFLLLPVLEERGGADAEFIRERLGGFKKILDYYKSEYAQKNGLLANLDKWCVVEWPANWRDGYDVDIAEGKICKTMHNVINAWYIGAIKCYNKTARKLGEPEYPGEAELVQAFQDAFYDSQRKLFKDSAESSHSSFQANIFPWFLGLCPDNECSKNIVELVRQKRMQKSLLFTTFPMLASLRRDGEEQLLYELLTDDSAWLNMIKEGATSTFEGWSKDSKWNTSLFHLTFTYAAVFMVDWDVGKALDLR